MPRHKIELAIILDAVEAHWQQHSDWSLEHLIQAAHRESCCSFIDDHAMLYALDAMNDHAPYGSGELDRYHDPISEHDYRKAAAQETRIVECEAEAKLQEDWNG